MASSHSRTQQAAVRLTPREADVNLVNEMMAHEAAVALLDEEIEGLMRNVRQLQFKKSQHQEKIKHYKGLMTLARRLPAEILASIFEECGHDGWTLTPLTASHVCSEWRKAASIATVWSHIYVNCDAKDPTGRTRFWLGKAQNSSLHITIDVRNDILQLPSVMELLLERISNWRTFTINSSLLSHSNYILSFCVRAAPELRLINISVTQEFDEVDGELDGRHDLVGLVNSFRDASRLQMLRINRNILPSHGTIPPSITDLSLTLPRYDNKTRSSITKLLHLLEGLPLLGSLTVSLVRGQAREFLSAFDDSRTVSLLKLRALVLIGSSDIFGVLPHLVTPSLGRLQLRSSLDPLGYPDEEVGSYVVQLIQRASPPLELFELFDIDFSLGDFSACFAGLPYLKELRLHDSQISDSIIQTLHGRGGLCPLLERLDLRWCGQVTGRALSELVKSRIRPSHSGNDDLSGPPLTSITGLTVINCSFVKEQDIFDLAEITVCQVVMGAADYCRKYHPLSCRILPSWVLTREFRVLSK